jgi:AcrR family transcriptional regulator
LTGLTGLKYFPNKQAVVDEVRARFGARFDERILRAASRVPTLPLREAIREWVHTIVELHAESPGVHHELGRGTPAHAHAPMVAFLASYLESRGDEVRWPDRELAARLLLDAGEALVHGTALREPELLHDEAWVAEVCEMLSRYAAAD